MVVNTPNPGETPATLTFFNEACAAFEAACRVDSVREFTYRLPGGTLRLRFAGDALIPVITPALAHLAAPVDGAADLTVLLWDVQSTGTPLPPRPWDWNDSLARGDIPSLSDERFQTVYLWYARLLEMLDREQHTAIYCTADAAELPFDFRGSPLLHILHWWLQPLGLQLVHGGAVGIDGKGVLLAGKGGAGKSTTALACLNSRLRYAADDYCLLDASGEPYVYSLYSSAKVAAQNLQRLPHLDPALAGNPGALRGNGEKVTFFLCPHYPEKLIGGFPLHAVLVPRITGEPPTRIVPTSRMDGLKALTISTMVQLSGANKAMFEAMTQVVRQVPCYELQLGTDMPQLVAVLEDFVYNL